MKTDGHGHSRLMHRCVGHHHQNKRSRRTGLVHVATTTSLGVDVWDFPHQGRPNAPLLPLLSPTPDTKLEHFKVG
jgi:hypothetical protein